MAAADVVIVSHNNRDQIRACVEPLAGDPELSVIVVDNDSQDGTLEGIADLRVHAVQRRDNLGFAFACNVGWREGGAPVAVFLNPDTVAEPAAIRALAGFLEREPSLGAIGPLVLDEQGAIYPSQRRYATLWTSLAAAFFLPRIWKDIPWSTDVVDPRAYERRGSPEWLSGACLAVRRDVLERLSGFDDRFFMYFEDMDLGRRIRDAGFDVRFEPSVSITHIGGASAPRARLIPVMTESRLLYAHKHRGARGAVAERAATILHSLTHVIATTQGTEARRAYLRSLVIAARDPIASLGRDAFGKPRRPRTTLPG